MDVEDGLYLVATGLIAIGAWRTWGDGYGLLCLGGMLALWPFISRILSGPPVKDEK